MDGLSVAASLVGIGAVGCQVAIKLYSLATQISTASDRISSISNDVSLTSSVLQQLGELMKQRAADDGTSIFSRSGLETTRTSATMCEDIFKAIEQAAKDASEQVRGRGRIVGKIKLSKSEKAKWPFLQPSIEALRNDLREAKGTLMLMLQVTTLAFSKKMADGHEAVSTHIVEQRDIIHAILELSKQAQAKESMSTALPVNSSGNGSSEGATSQSQRRQLWPDGESTLAPSLPSCSVASLPIRPNILMAIPAQGLPDRETFAHPEERTLNIRPWDTGSGDSIRSVTQGGDGNLSDCTPAQSLRGGSVYAPTESTANGDGEKGKILELFLMKPIIQDLVDVIQLSWKIHKAQMQQADIRKQISKNDQEGHPSVFDLYQDLYGHEHKAIDNEIAKAGAGASLVSLKRTTSNLWHRDIYFKGVPGLQFVVERLAQRASFSQAAEPFIYEPTAVNIKQEVTHVRVGSPTASEVGDEKRKRNAGASSRFRQQRKEKERNHEWQRLGAPAKPFSVGEDQYTTRGQYKNIPNAVEPKSASAVDQREIPTPEPIHIHSGPRLELGVDHNQDYSSSRRHQASSSTPGEEARVFGRASDVPQASDKDGSGEGGEQEQQVARPLRHKPKMARAEASRRSHIESGGPQEQIYRHREPKRKPRRDSYAGGGRERPLSITVLEEDRSGPPISILHPPRNIFSKDLAPLREGVAPLKDASKKGIPPNARWTKLDRKFFEPDVLVANREIYRERNDGNLVVKRVLTAEEIMRYKTQTRELRYARDLVRAGTADDAMRERPVAHSLPATETSFTTPERPISTPEVTPPPSLPSRESLHLNPHENEVLSKKERKAIEEDEKAHLKVYFTIDGAGKENNPSALIRSRTSNKSIGKKPKFWTSRVDPQARIQVSDSDVPNFKDQAETQNTALNIADVQEWLAHSPKLVNAGDASPRQSIARSLEEHDDHVHLGASGLPVAEDPIPEIRHIPDSDSDLNTNPSIIQGPIGSVQHGSRDHWQAAFPGQSRNPSTQRGDSYSPPMNKDEGYLSVPLPGSSSSVLSADNKASSPDVFEGLYMDVDVGMMGEDDPFVGSDTHVRHLSGYSHGMEEIDEPEEPIRSSPQKEAADLYGAYDFAELDVPHSRAVRSVHDNHHTAHLPKKDEDIKEPAEIPASTAEEPQAWARTGENKRKRRIGAGHLQKECMRCHTRVTPEWRRGPSGNRDLCNSCGLRWAGFGGPSPDLREEVENVTRESPGNDDNNAEVPGKQLEEEWATPVTRKSKKGKKGRKTKAVEVNIEQDVIGIEAQVAKGTESQGITREEESGAGVEGIDKPEEPIIYIPEEEDTPFHRRADRRDSQHHYTHLTRKAPKGLNLAAEIPAGMDEEHNLTKEETDRQEKAEIETTGPLESHVSDDVNKLERGYRRRYEEIARQQEAGAGIKVDKPEEPSGSSLQKVARDPSSAYAPNKEDRPYPRLSVHRYNHRFHSHSKPSESVESDDDDDDDDEEEDKVSVENVMDEAEAERVVRELLEKYTTLFATPGEGEVDILDT